MRREFDDLFHLTFFRYCQLGSQCDMVEYSPGVCRYFPHVAYKGRNLMDVLKKSIHGETVYFMECGQELSVNLLTDSDPIANDVGGFDMGHTCTDTANFQFGVAEDVASPSMFKSHIAGFQSLTMSICRVAFEVTRSRVLTVADIDALGFSQEYIQKIRPGAVATSHGWFKVSHRAQCIDPPLQNYPLVQCPKYSALLADTGLGLKIFAGGTEVRNNDMEVQRLSSNNICSVNQQCENTNDFVNVVGIGEFPLGDISINSSAKTAEALGLGIVLGGTELLIDPPFHVGCFQFEDATLDALTPTTVQTAKECLIACNDQALRYAAVLDGTNCYCFNGLPQESVSPSKVKRTFRVNSILGRLATQLFLVYCQVSKTRRVGG